MKPPYCSLGVWRRMSSFSPVSGIDFLGLSPEDKSWEMALVPCLRKGFWKS
jgi:hypothetical protein